MQISKRFFPSIAGYEYDLIVTFVQTYKGSPAQGPSYASGGEPAEAPEFIIKSKKLYDNDQEVSIPQWLDDRLDTWLYEDDQFEKLCQAAESAASQLEY